MNKKELINAFFSDNSVAELTKTASMLFKASVMVTDSSFHIVSYSGTEKLSLGYKTAVMHGELSVSACRKIEECFSGNLEQTAFFQNGGKNYAAGILNSGGTEVGYAVFEFDGKPKLPEKEDLLLCCGLLAKQLFLESRKNGVLSTADEILTDLFDSKFENEQIFNLRVSGTFLSHFSPEKFAIIKLGEKSLCDLNSVKNAVKDGFHASYPFFYKDGLITFIHKDHDIEKLISICENFSLKAVISVKANSLYEMKNEYKILEKEMEYFSAKQKSFAVYEENFAVFSVLSSLTKTNAFKDPDIQKIYEYDIKNHTDLCLTLYLYLTNNRSRLKTGKKLFIHPNTVSYRLSKIEEELEVDISKPFDFYKLFSLSVFLVDMGFDKLFIKEFV